MVSAGLFYSPETREFTRKLQDLRGEARRKPSWITFVFVFFFFFFFFFGGGTSCLVHQRKKPPPMSCRLRKRETCDSDTGQGSWMARVEPGREGGEAATEPFPPDLNPGNWRR